MILRAFLQITIGCGWLLIPLNISIGLAYWNNSDAALRAFFGVVGVISAPIYLASPLLPTRTDNPALFSIALIAIGGGLASAYAAYHRDTTILAIGVLLQAPIYFVFALRNCTTRYRWQLGLPAAGAAILFTLFGTAIGLDLFFQYEFESFGEASFYLLHLLAAPIFYALFTWVLTHELRSRQALAE